VKVELQEEHLRTRPSSMFFFEDVANIETSFEHSISGAFVATFVFRFFLRLGMMRENG
jgi:hypothetical protein